MLAAMPAVMTMIMRGLTVTHRRQAGSFSRGGTTDSTHPMRRVQASITARCLGRTAASFMPVRSISASSTTASRRVAATARTRKVPKMARWPGVLGRA